MRGEQRLLVHHCDAVRRRISRRAKTDALAAPEELAGIPLEHAGDDLHHGRFAGSVFAHQQMDFTFIDVEVALAEGDYATEPFLYLAKLEQHPRIGQSTMLRHEHS